MKTPVMFLTAATLSVFGGATLAAEDHSQHQQPAQQTDEHAQHQQMQHNEHAQHEQPAEQSDDQSEHQHDEHAGHNMPAADEPTESEQAHIPPDPPQHVMGDMSSDRMIELMQMEDVAPYSMLLLDQLEWQNRSGAEALSWEFDAWYGDDYNKIWFETEGERADGEEDGRLEMMWDHIIAPWWSLQTGLRQDFGPGPKRNWLDLGIQGMAPYFFDIDAALYVGEEGRTSARFSVEYDMLITQRLILQPELEVRAFGKDDPENGIGSGLSDMELGLRLRYEIRRELAPYVGLHWERKFGKTADFARDEGEDPSEVVVVAGVHAWF
jgi:copper resistance protein B